MKAASGIRRFDGGVAVVTGAASGIGLALARELASRGAIVILADLQADRVQEAAERIAAEGGKAAAAELDVADPEAVRAVIQDAVTAHGRLDYLFNIAGIVVSGEAEHYTPEVMQRVMATNFGGVYNGVCAAYPIMIEQGFGHIVNMSSISGLIPMLGIGYTASKHAIVGLSLALHREATPRGVRVSVVCPGPVRTEMFRDGGAFGLKVSPLPQRAVNRRRKAMTNPLLLDAPRCANRVLRAVAWNRPTIVLPFGMRVFWLLYRAFPRAMLRIMRKR